MVGLMTPISVAASMFAAQTLNDGTLLDTTSANHLDAQYEITCQPADIITVLMNLTDTGTITPQGCDAAELNTDAK